KNSLYLQMNS
nr:immunoglobulin heavy chain junction region [Homo sapiens]